MIIADNSMEALVCLKERIDNELENVREKSIEGMDWRKRDSEDGCIWLQHQEQEV